MTCQSANLGPGEWLSDIQSMQNGEARLNYLTALALGVAREQARGDLPLTTYTELYWKVDLHNLLHFLSLRMDSHAQKEIRDFANAIGNVIKDWVPLAWEAFVDYRLEGCTLSRMELQAIKTLITHNHEAALKLPSGGFAVEELVLVPPRMTLTPQENIKYAEEWEAELRAPIADWDMDRQNRFLVNHGLTNLRERQEFLGKIV